MCRPMKRNIQKGFHVAPDNMNQRQPEGIFFRRRNFFLMFLVLFCYIHSRLSIRAHILVVYNLPFKKILDLLGSGDLKITINSRLENGEPYIGGIIPRSQAYCIFLQK